MATEKDRTAGRSPDADSNQHADLEDPPRYLAAMNDVLKAVNDRRREDRQVAFQTSNLDGPRQGWEDGWNRFEGFLLAYLNGETSRSMVEELITLDGVVESVGFDDKLASLATDQSLPDSENEHDQIDLAVCRLVIGIWSEIRFNRESQAALIAQLDDNAARIAVDHVGFVREIIEAGGLPDCLECSQQLKPSEVGRRRCGDCIARQQKTLHWLGVAIECEYRYENTVYGDSFDSYFPEWSGWRRRLRELYGRNRTDFQLWEDWIGYAQEHRGLDEQQFLGTLRRGAESLLPPI